MLLMLPMLPMLPMLLMLPMLTKLLMQPVLSMLPMLPSNRPAAFLGSHVIIRGQRCLIKVVVYIFRYGRWLCGTHSVATLAQA